MALENGQFSRNQTPETQERLIARLEERIAAEAATSRHLLDQITNLAKRLTIAERSTLESRLINAIEQRVIEFETFEQNDLRRTMRYWTTGLVIGAGGLMVTGMVPAAVALALSLTLTVPVTISKIRRWVVRQKGSKTSTKLRQSLGAE